MAGYQSKLPPGILSHGLPQVKEVQPAQTSIENTENKKEESKPGNVYIVIVRVWWISNLKKKKHLYLYVTRKKGD